MQIFGRFDCTVLDRLIFEAHLVGFCPARKQNAFLLFIAGIVTLSLEVRSKRFFRLIRYFFGAWIHLVLAFNFTHLFDDGLLAIR